MTKTLPEGKQNLESICSKLRKETLEPAKQEADYIINQAQEKAEEIIKQAEKHAEKLLAEARAKAEKERQVFQTSLRQGAKQALEALRQQIERDLFVPELAERLDKATSDAKVLAKLINHIASAIEKEGIDSDLEILISKNASAEEVSKEVSKEVLDKLAKGGITLGAFGGGVEVRLVDKKLTLVMTSETLAQLLGRYVRKDFRELFFQQEKEEGADEE